MSNHTYTSDLLADALFRAGEPTDGTSDFAAQALIYLNHAYQIISVGGGEFAPDIDEDWLWLYKRLPGVLTLLPKISNTASVVNNSSAVSLSTALSLSTVNYFVTFGTGQGNAQYRVLSQSDSYSITLDSVYIGDTNSGLSCNLYKLEYDLASDILRLLGSLKESSYTPIDGVSLEALERRYPYIVEGYPKLFAFVGASILRISHSVLNITRVEYQYLYKPSALLNSALETPAVPQEYRKILSDIATYYLLLDKESNKAAGLVTLIRSGLVGMARDNNYNIAKLDSKYATVYPRKHLYNYRRTRESGLLIP